MAGFTIGKKYRGQGTNESVTEGALAAMRALSADAIVRNYQAEGIELAEKMTAAGDIELGHIGDFMADNLLGIPSKRNTGNDYDYKTGNKAKFKPKRNAGGTIIESLVDIPTQIFTRGMAPMNFYSRNPETGQRRLANNQPFDIKKIHQASLQWPQLRASTIKRKQRRGARDPAGFFADTGELYNYFKTTIGEAVVKGTGGVKVTFDKAAFVPTPNRSRPTVDQQIGSLRIKIAPRVTPAGLPALASGEWDDDSNERMPIERRILPSWVVKKLGRNLGGDVFRPLFQPTLAFWLLHRIPRAISKALFDTVRAQQSRKST